MTDRELMQQALDVLEEINKLSIGENAICLPAEIDGAMNALRERLAQPEQKPVANISTWHKNGEQHAELWNWDKGIETLPDGDHDLYTTPPHRKPLTDEQVREIAKQYALGLAFPYDSKTTPEMFARAIEAAHGIKEKRND